MLTKCFFNVSARMFPITLNVHLENVLQSSEKLLQIFLRPAHYTENVKLAFFWSRGWVCIQSGFEMLHSDVWWQNWVFMLRRFLCQHNLLYLFIGTEQVTVFRDSICDGSLSGHCLTSKSIIRALQYAHCMSTRSTCVPWDFCVACITLGQFLFTGTYSMHDRISR